MKKIIAIVIACAGALLLVVSLTVFGIGSAGTLNYSDQAGAAGFSPTTYVPPRTGEPGPVSTTVPSNSDTAAAAELDPTESPAFKAMSADEQENSLIWLDQQQIITDCMNDKGFDYTYEATWMRTPGVRPVNWIHSLPESERDAAFLALWGDTGAAADYHWEDAGCDGYAVHVTGQDSAH